MRPDQLAALHRIAEAAVAAERETGCPAEISAARGVVESDWLRAAPGNNCFGIIASQSLRLLSIRM
jgi:flagellum-specific peptidoglycan hydrolase FlgJ